MDERQRDVAQVNIVVLRGRLSRAAEERVLGSGHRLVAFDIIVQRPGERPDTVPVSWIDAPPAITLLEADEEVVVLGRVRRRFFRSSGGTESRTEVAADQVVPTRHAKRAAAAIAAAVAVLESN